MISRTKKFSPLTIIALTVGLLLLCLFIIYTISIFLLGFAGVLLAILLYTISSFISRKTGLGYLWCLLITLVTLIVIIGGIFVIATPLIASQLTILIEELPAAYDQFIDFMTKHFHTSSLSTDALLDKFVFKNDKLLTQATEIFSFTVGTIAGVAIFLLLGVYLAYSPFTYIKGFLYLVPPKRRPKIADVLNKIAIAMRYWLFGKFVAMVSIGILTMLGLWLLDMPLVFILGLLAGLLTFIPYIGPILSSIPAILIALTISPWKALYVVILYLIIHAIEGYLITPYIEQRTVSLPPALTIVSQMILILLVGFVGLLLASPITLLVVVIIRELYVRKQK